MKPFTLFLLLLAGVYACREQQPKRKFKPSPDYDKGKSLLSSNKDSAFYYFFKVATSAKDSLQIALAYCNMGYIQNQLGDYFGSQESLSSSLQYLDEKDTLHLRCLASDYNELGNVSSALKDYESAIRYYDLALKFENDSGYIAVIFNNKGVAYRYLGKIDQAITAFRSGLEIVDNDQNNFAMILSNLAYTSWLQDNNYQAKQGLYRALQIRTDLDARRGLNASYAHLSDYYAGNKLDSALQYAQRMLANAISINSPDDELEALEKLIALSPDKAVKAYHLRYQHLNDSLQTARNKAKNQFALIRYESEKNKADNLVLQVQLERQGILFGSVVLLIVLFVIVLINRSRKRRHKLEWESKQALREQQLKTSQKVHDVVANGLYGTMTEIEYQEFIDKESLLNRLEELYEKSRDISYEAPGKQQHEYQEKIARLLTSFATPGTRVMLTGNNSNTWNKLNDHMKRELELVLQELMVNMKKHSAASNVVVKFSQMDSKLHILYTDDGVGFSDSTILGNGLNSTENRIKKLGGQFTFDSAKTKGLRIEIDLPI